jgi:hypothetical protein
MKHSNVRGVFTLGAFVIAAALPMIAADPAAPNSSGPLYNPSAEVRFSAVITGARQVPEGNPLPGLHVTAQSKAGVTDVYLGPSDFLRIFKTNFPVGAPIQVIGSRVKMGDSESILAREVTEGDTTLTLRDFGGAPVWEHWGVPADRSVATGG